jgi:transketolase
MRDIFIKNIFERAKNDRNIILITGDLGFGVLNEFSNKLPEQFINAGVAEQNMTGMAAGMALDGRLPFTYSIGNFPTLRCLEQIRNDILYHELPVTIIAVGGGFSYGQLGMSHHATEDIGILRPLPGLRIFAPSDDLEAMAIANFVVSNPAPTYIRLDKSKLADQSDAPFISGALRKLRSGSRVLIIGYGGVLQEAILAANRLEYDNISCAIYSSHTLKPFDSTSFINIAKCFDTIVTLEEHSIIGGLASIVSETFVRNSYIPTYYLPIALQDQFCSVVGTQEYLRKVNRLDADSIYSRVTELLVGKI